MKSDSAYVLVTPVKNEERLIGQTIASVTSQTVLPTEWVIVSDGSTDRTEEIVLAAQKKDPWIRLISLPQRSGRNFGAVVRATEIGVDSLVGKSYNYIGLLDSDLSFRSDYFEKVISQFQASPQLGLAGGVVVDVGTHHDRLPRNRQDVPGAVQFFRRRCFEALGGLLAIPEGGWDSLTCARARMLGFETRLLTHLIVDHLKPRNIAEGGLLSRSWKMGIRDYAVGYHPIFEFVKCISRLRDRPVLVGGITWWAGYCHAAILGRQRLIPPELLLHIRVEQLSRVRDLLPLWPKKATHGTIESTSYADRGP